MEMIRELGYCTGIENYSRYLSGRAPGEPPPTLFEYLPDNALVIVDESHATIPQIGAMYKGDRSRKETLVEFGFRLPSALDNRPLRFEEWELLVPQAVFVSATPGAYEQEHAGRAEDGPDLGRDAPGEGFAVRGARVPVGARDVVRDAGEEHENDEGAVDEDRKSVV